MNRARRLLFCVMALAGAGIGFAIGLAGGAPIMVALGVVFWAPLAINWAIDRRQRRPR